ncbi:MAG TPA: polysaccharide biosynthesis C-terminal domain-containing protein, partial [Candidatus Pelethocola excrementipullorum]|nr:polysaccharide biosynthesis C-terminal domain-containing protein [Candidatus Pelethocola excrementipullorum]
FMLVTPVIFTTFIYNASAYLDSYIFSSMQGWHGVASKTISEQYGEFSNYYVTLINVPLALASASASAMMPVVSGNYATGEKEVANRKISETIRLAMFICIPAAVGLGVLAHPIMGVLFPDSTELGTNLLMFGAVSVIFSALSTITNSVLQSIGKQRIALRNAAISLGLNLVSLSVMLFVAPDVGIYAMLVANILFAVCMCVLNGLSLRQYLDYKNEFKDSYGKPLLAAAGMGLAAWMIYYGLFALTRRPFIGLIISIPAAIVVYMILFVVITGTPEEEMRKFPLGTRIISFLRLIRVYR